MKGPHDYGGRDGAKHTGVVLQTLLTSTSPQGRCVTQRPRRFTSRLDGMITSLAGPTLASQ